MSILVPSIITLVISIEDASEYSGSIWITYFKLNRNFITTSMTEQKTNETTLQFVAAFLKSQYDDTQIHLDKVLSPDHATCLVFQGMHVSDGQDPAIS